MKSFVFIFLLIGAVGATRVNYSLAVLKNLPTAAALDVAKEMSRVHNRTTTIDRFSTVDVTFGGEIYEACLGDVVRVIWDEFHIHNLEEMQTSQCSSEKIGISIVEFKQKSSYAQFSADELSAAEGQTRHFRCGSHCELGAKFSTFCPSSM